MTASAQTEAYASLLDFYDEYDRASGVPRPFYVVEEYSNWGHWDYIDGHDVKPGLYIIRWPDGIRRVEDVQNEHKTFIYGDMGRDGTGYDDKAYFTQVVNGHKTKVYIRGLEVSPIEGKAK